MSETTYQQVRNTVVEEIAIKLKENYRMLANGNPVPPNGAGGDKEYRRMAGEMIDSKDGKFRLYNSEDTVSKNSVTQQLNTLDSLVGNDPTAKNVLGDAKVMAQVPDDDDIKKIAAAIDSGVKKTSFSMNDFSFSGLMSMIANFIAGFMDWMMGKEIDGKKAGFWEHVGNHAGQSASQSVRRELNGLRAQDADMQAILTEERMDGIDAVIKQKAMQKATGNGNIPLPTPKASLEKTEVKAKDPRLELENVRLLIDAEIAHTINDVYFAKEDNPNTPDIVEGSARKAVMGATLQKEKSANEVQAAFLSATKAIVHDSKTKNMTLDQIRETLANKVTKDLDWNWGSWSTSENLLKEMIVKGADGETLIKNDAVEKIKDSSIIYDEGIKLTDGQNVASQQIAGASASGEGQRRT